MDKAALPPSSPRLPLEFGEDGDRSLKILKEANCIARTAGKTQLSMALLRHYRR